MPPLGRASSRAALASLNVRDAGLGRVDGPAEDGTRAFGYSWEDGVVDRLSGRDETGVRRPVSLINAWVVAAVEEPATGAGSGSTMAIGTRRRFGGGAVRSGVDISMGFICIYVDDRRHGIICRSVGTTHRLLDRQSCL